MGIILTDDEMKLSWMDGEGTRTNTLQMSKPHLKHLLKYQVVKVVKYLDEANDLKELDNKLQELREELSKL